MSDQNDASEPSPRAEPRAAAAGAGAPEAHARRSRWMGLVWAVPLAALIIVALIGVRAFNERGIEVVVTFETAAGARVKDTKVMYQGLEAGHVTRIAINEDGRRVDMTLLIDPRAGPGLTTETRFWLVGAKPDLNDIASLKAAVAGLTIGVAPGIGGRPTRHFDGLNAPPIIMPDTQGRAFVLATTELGTVQVGAPIFYRGLPIGKLTGVRFTAPGDFRLDFFIFDPYDRLIGPNGAFWVSSPVQLSLTDKGASASLEHPTALLNGAIEFDFVSGLPTGGPTAQASPAGTEFALYESRKDAENGPSGPEVPYAFRFVGPAGELPVGAPVRLLGFQVGVVKTVHLEIDAKTGAASTYVVAALFPKKMHIAAPPGPNDAGAWRAPTDAAVGRLLNLGLRARLVQTPPLIGSRVISLDAVRGAGQVTFGAGEPKMIPSDESGGGVDEITGQINQLLAKVNRIPLDAIGQDVQRLTSRLSSLAASPQLTESVQHLNGTLAQVDRMMAEVAPQVGPLVAKLNRAADETVGTAAAARGLLGGGGGAAADANLPQAIQELSDAARSIRALADYLGRHPDALVRGRGDDTTNEPRKEGR